MLSARLVGRAAASSRVLGRGGGLARSLSAGPVFHYQELFDLAPDKKTEYVKLTSNGVSVVDLGGTKFLKVEPEALRLLSARAMTDIAHLLRPAHLQQLSNILKDPEATSNDRFVALELLKNANIASNFVLPGCQDTGTAIAIGKRGQMVLTDGHDEAHISRGVFDTYTGTNLRYSQVAPLDMYKEVNTKTNLPAQIELYATPGSEYHFLFMAKGGGSANKTYLYQQTKALLNPASLMKFLEDNIKTMSVNQPAAPACLVLRVSASLLSLACPTTHALPLPHPSPPLPRPPLPAAARLPARPTTWPSSSAGCRRSRPSRRSRWPRPSTTTRCPRRATSTAAPFAIWRRSSRCWR